MPVTCPKEDSSCYLINNESGRNLTLPLASAASDRAIVGRIEAVHLALSFAFQGVLVFMSGLVQTKDLNFFFFFENPVSFVDDMTFVFSGESPIVTLGHRQHTVGCVVDGPSVPETGNQLISKNIRHNLDRQADGDPTNNIAVGQGSHSSRTINHKIQAIRRGHFCQEKQT